MKNAPSEEWNTDNMYGGKIPQDEGEKFNDT